jgi:hypothetical protein
MGMDMNLEFVIAKKKAFGTEFQELFCREIWVSQKYT